MKIYLASFKEVENHGPGRKISIADSKPNNLEISGAFEPFIPDKKIRNTYIEKQKLERQNEAGKYFVDTFSKQLFDFFNDANLNAKRLGKTLQELLPFQDGDTLLSWERKDYTSYRPIVARFLVDNGYEVSLG